MKNFPSFDELLKLHQEKPEELERFRQEQIDSLINSAPARLQRRLRGLQFQIDAQRQLHKDSVMGACIKISEMMHESFTELRLSLNQLTGLNDPLLGDIEAFEAEERQAAEVLPFPA